MLRRQQGYGGMDRSVLPSTTRVLYNSILYLYMLKHGEAILTCII